ncbi:MAG: type I methionyl aminopeptidase [Armatimonadota bacterium]|nr:type I methionyl aminopeptidase [Armatimonadota bacterium]MDR7534072.1 type I methionyl aminopeptidase [Armatimonadota bacterium]MDR7537464.1 type I methionyl aminopeptidase [Armatimonadota bacterium]
MKAQGVIVLKTPDQIARMREAGRLAARALREVAAAVAPGVTTGELERIADAFIRSAGGVPSFKDYRGFPASICTSVNDEVVHGIPSPRVLREGEIVSLDLGVYLHGFHADVAQTVAVGRVAESARRLIETAERALARGVAQARPGATVGDVGWAIQTIIEAAGCSAVREFAGHGIGRNLHEEPQVPNVGRPGTGPRLAVGMTLAIEPMVTLGGPEVFIDADGWTVRTRDGSLAAHAEHTVAITREGPAILTLDADAGRDGAGTVY